MSNRRVVHTGIVVTIGRYTLFAATAQAQMGYPLVCRSGGGMQLSWSALASARTHFIAYYSRASNAAGTSSPLGSGQCTGRSPAQCSRADRHVVGSRRDRRGSLQS